MDQRWDRSLRSVLPRWPRNTRKRQSLRRLGGEDSGFLELERPGQPMTNMYLIVFGDCADGLTVERPAPITIESLRRRLIERLDILPSLRWRLVQVPLRLHH